MAEPLFPASDASPLPVREALKRWAQHERELLEAEREALRAKVPEAARVWLAMVPVWSFGLAEACRFPAGGGSLTDTVRRLQEEGLCSVFPPLPPLPKEPGTASTWELTLGDRLFRLASTPESTPRVPAAELAYPDPEREFWMERPQRVQVLTRMLREATLTGDSLRDTLLALGQSIEAAATTVPVPLLVSCWSALVRNSDEVERLDRFLLQRIDERLEQGDSAEALTWIEAMRTLSVLLGDSAAATLERAGRRLRRFHRRREDEKHLLRFLERPDQTAAVRDLVSTDGPAWALHFIGDGGVGKTMLTRYISARLALELGTPGGPGATTAHLDFDFLNPDFPSRAPALLLDQLAQELRVHDREGESGRLFHYFDQQVLKLHERHRSVAGGMQTPAVTLVSEEFERLTDLFVEALTLLPQPVIFLLDTCEELARIQADGTVPDNVRATFTILEQIQKRLRNEPNAAVRVIFCGRRPLASAGDGWQSLRTPLGVALPPRPELRLFEIRAFTRSEAETYLREREHVREELIEPIIQQSAEQGPRADRFSWTSPESRPTEASRFNPLKLSRYASWSRADPKLTAEVILDTDDDRYVQMRIVRRIRHPELLRLLPAVSLLGRFDLETIRAASDADPATFGVIYDELSHQEWIDRQPSGFLEVSRSLRDDLKAYFEQHERAALDQARTRLADALERLTLEAPFSALDVSHFDAALRILNLQPARAAAWWAKVEARLAAEAPYGWPTTLTERLLASGGAAERSSVRGAVLATRAAAVLHTYPGNNLTDLWSQAARAAADYPEPAGQARLRRRARLGQIASRCWHSPGVDEKTHSRFWATLRRPIEPKLDEQRAASLIAALEAWLEVAERKPSLGDVLEPRDVVDVPIRIGLSEGLSPELRAFAWSLAGRAFLLLARAAPGRESWLDWVRPAFEQGRLLVARLEPTPESGAPRWLDWRPPENVSARLELEFIRVAAFVTLRPDEVLSAVETQALGERTLDADRLSAAILRLRAAIRFLHFNELPARPDTSAHTPAFIAYNAHQAFPTHSEAVAEAWAAAGRVDQALNALDRRFGGLESMGAFDEVKATDHARLGIIRRMRLRDEGRGYDVSFVESTRKEITLVAALNGLDGPKAAPRANAVLEVSRNPEAANLDWLHAHWRGKYALGTEFSAAAVSWQREHGNWLQEHREWKGPKPGHDSFNHISWWFDTLEASELDLRSQLPSEVGLGRDGGWRFGFPEDVRDWWEAHRDQPCEALTLTLRAAALNVATPEFASVQEESRKVLPAPLTELLPLVGARRAAEIALDEGELLALRLPLRAAVILEWSRNQFSATGDPVGAVLAGTATALSLAREGRETEAGLALDRVRKEYAGLREVVSELPAWESLEAMAEAPTEAVLTALEPRGWRPWLVRLVACLAWSKERAHPHGRLKPLLTWVTANYGATRDGRSVLPAELDGWLGTEEVPPHGTVVATELELAREPTPPLTLQIAARERQGSSPRIRQLEASIVFRGTQLPLEVQVTIPGSSPYQDFMAANWHLLSHLATLMPWQASSPAPVRLEVERSCSWVCWEALLANLKTKDRAPALPNFYRVEKTSLNRFVKRWSELRRIVARSSTVREELLLNETWSRVTRYGEFSYTNEALSGRRLESDPAFGPQVLHLIASPVETSAGVRLQLSSSEHVTQAQVRSSGEKWLKIEDIAANNPELGFCILQAPPQNARVRSDADREHVGRLRLCAAELFALGIPAVVTVPPLPERLAGRVSRHFAEALLAGYPSSQLAFEPMEPTPLARGPQLLLEALRAAREEILRTQSHELGQIPDSVIQQQYQSVQELAWDLCLYLDPAAL